MEYDVIIPKDISYIRKEIPMILEDAENEPSFLFRKLLRGLYDEMVYMGDRVSVIECKLEEICKQNEDC